MSVPRFRLPQNRRCRPHVQKCVQHPKPQIINMQYLRNPMELNRCSVYVFCATLCLRCEFFFSITMRKAPVTPCALPAPDAETEFTRQVHLIYNPTSVTHLTSFADYSIAHSAHYSKLVYASNSSPFLLRRWIGSLRISTPGLTLLESFRRLGKICKTLVRIVRQCITT